MKITCPICDQKKREHKANIYFQHNDSKNPLTNGPCLVVDQFWHNQKEDSYKCMYDGYIVSGYEVSKLKKEFKVRS